MSGDWSEFVLWEAASRDTIDVKRCYVDLAGDLVTGVLLSQIVYWHLPGRDGKTRLRVEKGGHFWLVKGREEWWEECRITAKQYDRAAKILRDLGVIETEVRKFGGRPQVHIRICTHGFLKALGSVMELRGKSMFPKGQDRLRSKGKMDIDERGTSYTENTTQTLETENNHHHHHGDDGDSGDDENEDVVLSRELARECLLTAAPDFSTVDDYLEGMVQEELDLVGMWSVAVHMNDNEYRNPAGFIRAAVAKGEEPGGAHVLRRYNQLWEERGGF